MLSSGFLDKIRERVNRLDSDILRELVLKFSDEQEFFQLILDSMMEGVLVVDEEELVQYANRTATIFLGKTLRQLLGRAVLDGLESPELYNLIKKALQDGERIRNREVSLIYPADRILNVHVFPLLRDGGIYGNVVIFMDITREKEEEQRLRRAESMAALSNITAGIAHEIKNPLGALDIHLQLMELELEKDGDREKMQRYLGVVREEVGRLNGIVVHFLDAIRPLSITRVRTDVESVIRSAGELFAPGFRERGISFELDIAEMEDMPLLDPGLFRQVLVNLIKNAGEAISGNGVVKVVSRVDGDSLLVAVEDSGCGIEPERLHAICEPYNSSKPSGTGLGLTIVYRIIREHGGEVHVESQPGEGTRFAIQLPMKPQLRKMISR